MRKSTLIAVAVASVSSVAVGTPVAYYGFDGDFSSSIGGAPDLTIVGNDDIGFGQSNVSGVTTGSWSWEHFSGLRLDTSSLLTGDAWTVGISYAHSEVDGWRKIIDTQNLQSDSGWYNDRASMLQFAGGTTGSQQLMADVFADVVISFDGTSAVGYVNGIKSGDSSMSDASGISADDLLYFFIDDIQTNGNEAGDGTVASIVIWDTALSQSEVADLEPLVSIPAPSAVLAMGLSGLAATRRRR